MNRQEVDKLVQDYEKDLKAFAKARSAIEARMDERREEGTLEDLVEWPGTRASLNVLGMFSSLISVLIMVLVRCEGLVEDLKVARDKAPIQKPEFYIVPAGSEEET